MELRVLVVHQGEVYWAVHAGCRISLLQNRELSRTKRNPIYFHWNLVDLSDWGILLLLNYVGQVEDEYSVRDDQTY